MPRVPRASRATVVAAAKAAAKEELEARSAAAVARVKKRGRSKSKSPKEVSKSKKKRASSGSGRKKRVARSKSPDVAEGTRVNISLAPRSPSRARPKAKSKKRARARTPSARSRQRLPRGKKGTEEKEIEEEEEEEEVEGAGRQEEAARPARALLSKRSEPEEDPLALLIDEAGNAVLVLFSRFLRGWARLLAMLSLWDVARWIWTCAVGAAGAASVAVLWLVEPAAGNKAASAPRKAQKSQDEEGAESTSARAPRRSPHPRRRLKAAEYPAASVLERKHKCDVRFWSRLRIAVWQRSGQLFRFCIGMVRSIASLCLWCLRGTVSSPEAAVVAVVVVAATALVMWPGRESVSGRKPHLVPSGVKDNEAAVKSNFNIIEVPTPSEGTTASTEKARGHKSRRFKKAGEYKPVLGPDASFSLSVAFCDSRSDRGQKPTWGCVACPEHGFCASGSLRGCEVGYAVAGDSLPSWIASCAYVIGVPGFSRWPPQHCVPDGGAARRQSLLAAHLAAAIARERSSVFRCAATRPVLYPVLRAAAESVFGVHSPLLRWPGADFNTDVAVAMNVVTLSECRAELRRGGRFPGIVYARGWVGIEEEGEREEGREGRVAFGQQGKKPLVAVSALEYHLSEGARHLAKAQLQVDDQEQSFSTAAPYEVLDSEELYRIASSDGESASGGKRANPVTDYIMRDARAFLVSSGSADAAIGLLADPNTTSLPPLCALESVMWLHLSSALLAASVGAAFALVFVGGRAAVGKARAEAEAVRWMTHRTMATLSNGASDASVGPVPRDMLRDEVIDHFIVDFPKSREGRIALAATEGGCCCTSQPLLKVSCLISSSKAPKVLLSPTSPFPPLSNPPPTRTRFSASQKRYLRTRIWPRVSAAVTSDSRVREGPRVFKGRQRQHWEWLSARALREELSPGKPVGGGRGGGSGGRMGHGHRQAWDNPANGGSMNFLYQRPRQAGEPIYG